MKWLLWLILWIWLLGTGWAVVYLDGQPLPYTYPKPILHIEGE